MQALQAFRLHPKAPLNAAEAVLPAPPRMAELFDVTQLLDPPTMEEYKPEIELKYPPTIDDKFPETQFCLPPPITE